MVEVVPDEERSHGHSQLLVCPVDAPVPAVAIGQDAEEHAPEVRPGLLELARQLGHQVHHQPPDHIVVDHPGKCR